MPDSIAPVTSGSWSPLSAPQDYATIAGQRTPGICRVEGFKNRSRWDIRQGPALSGARLRYRGFEPAQGKLVLTFTEPQHWSDWTAFAPTVRRAPLGERATHLEIEHPILASMDIRAVAVASVSQPAPVDDKGTWAVEIELIEYLEPLPAVSTPRGADTGEELTPVQREIEENTRTIAALAAGADV
ncbi:MAG: hypothetical protein J0L92_03630 [Deltaproteobacteria bacterium]|nr:hypothetical protein [Deltaproteobacteria bacterium]